ncbi:hypothetical protein ACFW04_014300 [Cataglyphis niger]
MKEKINSLKQNETWKIVNLPKKAKALKNKWVYRLKKKADSSIDRYKARLVVKGFTQRPGIDYMKTFSPNFAAKMKLYQFDIKTAYLNRNLEEDIHIETAKRI